MVELWTYARGALLRFSSATLLRRRLRAAAESIRHTCFVLKPLFHEQSALELWLFDAGLSATCTSPEGDA